MIVDIDAAGDHVHLLFYIWLADDSGLRMVEAVKRAASRGVACRVMVDDLGSRALIRSIHWRGMAAAGVDGRADRPGRRARFGTTATPSDPEVERRRPAQVPVERRRHHQPRYPWAARRAGPLHTRRGRRGHRPHVTDIELKHIVDLILKINAQCYNVEAANVRHEHEWRVWKDKLPDGKIPMSRA